MRSYRSVCYSLLVIWTIGGLTSGCSELPPPQLVPQPKDITWSDELLLEEGKVNIVVGEDATDVERYAAEMLSRNVARRYGRRWPIVTGSRTDDANVYILLGQRATNNAVDEWCSMWNIDLSASSPGHDGYVIEPYRHKDWTLILVGGSNGRGVIYGQDTLFQMIQRRGNDLTLAAAQVRDRPSVPWRGRPQTHYKNYMRTGELDAYMQARINWIDLRSGIYAFEPGAELEKDGIAQVIDEAHRRELIVYGVVNCGVEASEYPEVIRTFTEFIELGADGLWISFDDKGPGEDPDRIVREVLELGRAHGITGHLIGICPPKGDYQDIDTDFNKRIVGIPGMETAHWFWTRWPAERHLEQARSIGLKAKPAWWHNWPRIDERRLYVEPIPLSYGWHSPPYANLTGGGEHIDVIMPWGGNAYGPYYVIPSIGWWGWAPAQHDWDATRGRIYDIVYGPSQVATARAFDDKLVETRPYLQYAGDGNKWYPACPVRLVDVEDRSTVLAEIRRLKRLQEKLLEDSPSETLIDEGQLHAKYLEPMAAELRMLEAGARLPWPEYWWEAHQREVLTALYDGDLESAETLIDSVRERLNDELSAVSEAPEELGNLTQYTSWWKKRANLDASGWQGLLAERREDYRKLVEEYAYFVAVPDKLLAPTTDPPFDWGSGRWVIGNQVLAKVLPTEREYAWGCWMGGLYRNKEIEGAIFVAQRKNHSRPGEFSELEVEVPVAGARRDRLSLLMFVDSENKDAIGLQTTVGRWAGYRFVELLWDDQLLWEADLGVPRENGEWSMVDLPEIPEGAETLKLRLRVIDRRMLTVNHTIAVIGPMWLIERQDEYWSSRGIPDHDE